MGEVQLLFLLGYHDHGHCGIWGHHPSKPGRDGIYKHNDVPLQLHVRLFYELHRNDPQECAGLKTVF